MRTALLALLFCLPLAAQVTVNETTETVAVDLVAVEGNLRVTARIHRDQLHNVEYAMYEHSTGKPLGAGHYDLKSLTSATHNVLVNTDTAPNQVVLTAVARTDGSVAWSMTAAGDTATGVIDPHYQPPPPPDPPEPTGGVIDSLSSFWEGNPSAGVLWDYHGNRHGMHGGTAALQETGDIFGGGWKTTAIGQGMSIPASLSDFAPVWTFAAWVRVAPDGKILVRRSWINNYLILGFSGANRVQALCRDTSGGQEFVAVTVSDAVVRGDLALAWFAYDGSALRVGVNGSSWVIDDPAGPCASSEGTPIDLGHSSRQWLSSIGAVGRAMYWEGYIPTDAERADIYNGGLGRDYTYFNAAGFSEPTPPLQVSLVSSVFMDDADLVGQQGLYYLRPFPCKDWAMTCQQDYIWVRSTDHDSGSTPNPDGVYVGWSPSPAIPPASWEKVKDGAALTVESAESWTQLETPHIEYNGSGEVYLYAHGVKGNTGSPVQQVTHVWRTTDFVQWIYQGEALPLNMSGDSEQRSHTGYATVYRRGPNDWEAQSLCRGSDDAVGVALCHWTSVDGLAWTFSGFHDGADTLPAYASRIAWRNEVGQHLVSSQIALETAAPYNGKYPFWVLVDRDSSWSGSNNWIQDVRVYEENGTVHLYVKDGYKEPSVIRYYTGVIQ